MYEYSAIVVDVHDGDTLKVDIDLGLGVWMHKQALRLVAMSNVSINAPEVYGAEKAAGLRSKEWLVSQVLNRQVIVRTYKDKKEKFGRWLAEVELDGVDIGSQMVALGFAAYKQY